MSKWNKVWGRYGDHRLFRREGNDALYVADDSGGNPEETDDGPLRVIPPEEIILQVSNGYLSASVEVEGEGEGPQTDGAFVGLTPKASLALAQLLDIPIFIEAAGRRFAPVE